jgi:hypothetical protein
MPLRDALTFLGLWSLIGAGLFSIFVVFVFRSGLVNTARKEDGTLKERIPLRCPLVMAAFLLAIVGFLVLAYGLSLAPRMSRLGLWDLFLLDYLLYVILFLFDTRFIDGFVLGVWRPRFLHLPEVLGRESMRQHML